MLLVQMEARSPVRGWAVVCCIFGAGLGASPAAAVRAEAPEVTGRVAPHFVLDDVRRIDGKKPAAMLLPLVSSKAVVAVSGVIADVELRQVWTNHGDEPIEATYVFPASTGAAVHDLVMQIGERRIRADLKARNEARAVYEQAKAEGKTAALLEQHRPNIIEIGVANIKPGDRVEVTVRYTEAIVPKKGVYEVVLPQTVGPRYRGEATTAFTEQPSLSNGPEAVSKKAAFAWGVDVEVAAPVPIQKVSSPSHPIDVHHRAKGRVHVADRFEPGRPGPDRDFVLRVQLASGQIESGLMLYRTPRGQENFFLLMMEPPKSVTPQMMPPREIVFVIDVSGSMHGFPRDVTKRLIDRLLGELRSQDLFNVILFSGNQARLFPESVPATPANLKTALAFHNAEHGGGGTELESALKHALDLPTPSETYSRSFVVLTDGYIAADASVFDLVKARLGDANVFAFGVGSSVNRYLIEGLARAGRAEPFFVLGPTSVDGEVARFAEMVSRPALTHVEVNFAGLNTYDVVPTHVPDLMEQRPLVVFGKYKGPTRGRVVLTGSNGDGRFSRTLRIEDNQESKSARALRTLWAKARLVELADLPRSDEDRADKIRAHALRYRLLSEQTSFVAVDESRPGDGTHGAAAPQKVEQPGHRPHGVGIMGKVASASGGQTATGAGAGYGRKTVISLDEITIEGSLTKPEGMFLLSRRKAVTNSLIKPRKSFRRELMHDAAEVAGGTSPVLAKSEEKLKLEVEVLGPTRSGPIRAAFKRRSLPLVRCYERAESSGVIDLSAFELEIVLDDDDRVKAVRWRRPEHKVNRATEELARCLVRKTRRLQLVGELKRDEPEKPVVVTLRFTKPE